MSDIAKQKERVLVSLHEGAKRPSIRQVQEIQRLCDEIALLHKAAIDGIKSAQKRISSLNNADQVFHTYTAGGQRCHMIASDKETRF
ncbi:hypothetical protein [Litoreibacter arenae]|uniref:hypothetical protein n=1 Tax=Litoreibacter arenae TaxID=491388 RepID=UPI0012B537C9|nr:hypothetical protein [Litoreibacter arenae]